MQTIDIHSLPNLEFEELESHCVDVDWRAFETEIVKSVSSRLAPEDELSSIEDGESLIAIFRGVRHRIPLTITPHDRYVAISSLAHILKGRYQFWQLKDRLPDDSHSLLVLPVGDSEAMERLYMPWVERTIEKLEIGRDYFFGLSVPYCGNEENNPDFKSQAEALRKQREEALPLVEEAIKKAMDDLGLKKGFGLEAALKMSKKPWWKIW